MSNKFSNRNSALVLVGLGLLVVGLMVGTYIKKGYFIKGPQIVSIEQDTDIYEK